MSKICIPELLAPAGSIESLKAAVNAGADAVYLSGKRFGARQFARNFGLKEMEDAIEYAHLRGVKVYITVNTLIKETELSLVGDHLLQLYSLGADAVIVQDMGVARLARKIVPELDLHCSTQMTIHNPQGVNWAADNGFDRVVLAREMDIPDITLAASLIKKRIELEVFAHGAICYSYSGQCLLSSFIGGRSGNRGMCAQPCRKNYRLITARTDKYGKYIDSEEIPLKDHYLLSTRDLAIYFNLDRVVKAPVDSIKIEGRMRPPEYVANVVGVYREALDKLAKGKWKAHQKEVSKLKMCFNRGFSKGWLLSASEESVMGRDNPGNRGLYLGKVTSYNSQSANTIIDLKSKVIPEKGDGILFKDPKKTGTAANIWGTLLEYSPSARKGKLSLKLRKQVKNGSEVFITRKKSLVDEANKIVANPHLPRKIPLEIVIKINNELTPIAQIKAFPPNLEKLEIEYEADFSMENAIKRPLTDETIIKHLQKTGGTPFIIRDLQIDYPGNLFTSIQNLNHLRRQILEEVKERILKIYLPSLKEIESIKTRLPALKTDYDADKECRSTGKRPVFVNLAIYVDSIYSVKSALKAGCNIIYFQPKMEYKMIDKSSGDSNCSKQSINYKNYFEEIYSHLKEATMLCNESGSDLIWKWPDITSKDFIVCATNLLKNLPPNTINGIMIGNLGALWSLEEGFDPLDIYGSKGLNIWNHMAMDEVSEPINSITLSPELSKEELKKVFLHSKDSLSNHKIELLVQGNLEALVSKNCLSCVVQDKEIIKKIENSPYHFLGIKDSKNRIFQVETDENCRTHISNSVELCLIDHLPYLMAMGIDRLVIDARNKPSNYVREMLLFYQEALQLTIQSDPNLDKKLHSLKEKVKKISNGGITTGNFLRGVEG